ncbi:MAG: methyltransferase [Bacteroidetes bacterium]|nr:MAG: methyltransferase [Bacteroidota bacterium]
MHQSFRFSIKENCFESDFTFDQQYPLQLQLLSKRHWTPLAVCKKVAEYLAFKPGSKILDIGSGPGKFCLAASHFKPYSFFSGIEQREELVSQSNQLKNKLRNTRVEFLHGNFTQVNFKSFDGFYFYNSFYENIVSRDHIDESIDYSIELYEYYCRQLYSKLDEMPVDTRLATYHSLEDEIPPAYTLVKSSEDLLLKFWRKAYD